MKRCPTALAATLLAAAAWLPAHATTWDAAADFSATTTTNPNSVWSYGYNPAALAGYQFEAFDSFAATATTATWNDSNYISLGTPAFWKNLSGSTVVTTLPGQVALHPGPDSSADEAILRFTAPQAGVYSISAQFFAGDSGETDAWIVLNGDFASPLSSLGVTSTNPSYTAPSLLLAAGDTLDFVVGSHGSYFSDTTPLAVQVSAVPELPTAWLALAGLGLLAGGRRLARRAASAG